MPNAESRAQRIGSKSAPPQNADIVASALLPRKQRVVAVCASLFLLSCAPENPATPTPREPAAAPPRASQEPPAYTGTAACIGCHPDAGAAWQGSDHDRAMEPATPATVLGAFEGQRLELDGQEWQFLRRGDEFVVVAPEDGERSTGHRVAYTFGVSPLQQYLVPAAGGRLQPLPVAWDTRSAGAGGQRWFHLYEGEKLREGDPLHWLGHIQTWNHQCADCHSTALRRGYDEASGHYDTTWQELDVGCEACHGPGEDHVVWARSGADPGAAPHRGLIAPLQPAPGSWTFDPAGPIAQRSEAATHAALEVSTCAPCHSRRSQIAPAPEPASPLLDAYLPALLDEGLYFPNGRMNDEVYVWGSFQQSRMHAAGVTCSDCHEPHSLAVRGGPDAVCATCHLPAVFASPDHHGHPEDSSGASCVACHMPERTYMKVDARRDHSIQVPRPDLAERTGSPTVCLDCHPGRSAGWAAESLAARGALRSTPAPADAIAAAWHDEPGAGDALARVVLDAGQAPIVRATSASLLGRYLDRDTLPALRAALTDAAPLVRLGGVEALDALAPGDRLALGRERLRDPVRAVRIEAARALAAVPPNVWQPSDRAALARALGEYREAQTLHRDRPEAHLNLSQLDTQLGDLATARTHAEQALALAPDSEVAFVSLADVQRLQGEEREAEATLRRGLAAQPDAAALHLALGFSLVRQGQGDAAIEALHRAFALEPESSQIAYAYALALHGADRSDEAVEVLEAAIERDPRNRPVLIALATFERDRGRLDAAARWADALVDLAPQDASAQSLKRSLSLGGSAATRP